MTRLGVCRTCSENVFRSTDLNNSFMLNGGGILLDLITGAFSALQTAINGHLEIVFSSSLVAAAIFF
ncbi:hypothetical protein [Liquorilactobacillus uvarum]|uniref:hypothetical protein n=1 Tax=Liquorilactobacillus uvarum TaxID=303240 RepID=UPI0012EE4220|nr:hypothetical protein [Liquorilactobacillus uvarum]